MIDMEMDPCEDFYQFVCGKILNNTERPEKGRTWISEEKAINTGKLVCILKIIFPIEINFINSIFK